MRGFLLTFETAADHEPDSSTQNRPSARLSAGQLCEGVVISVVLYTPYWYNMGGGEKYLCAMAQALADDTRYDVTLLSDSRPLNRQELEPFFSVSLGRVRLRQTPRHLTRKTLSESAIAVVMTNYRSLGLPAAQTAYILQIPYPNINIGTVSYNVLRGEIRESAKNLLRLKLLSTCRKAPAVFVYSEFVRSALRDHHGLATTVLYPPIDDFSSERPKERSILSVGRFFRGQYNDKRYDLLIDVFRSLCQQQKNPGLQYWIAGSCSNDSSSQAWLAELQERARGYPIHFHVNVPHSTLADLYARASILWHAAGYGVNEQVHPEQTEHFGMTPVEAMSAGCIPLVVNAGGTRETVEHGVSGFLWSTPEELLNHTERLLHDSALFIALQKGARDRFGCFSRKTFTNIVLSRFRDLESRTG